MTLHTFSKSARYKYSALVLALLVSTSTTALAKTSASCLASVIWGEARGETLRGQLLVAETVLNRLADDNYPDTICGVVRQKSQYYTPKGADAETLDLAEKVIAEEVALPVTGATHFHHSRVKPTWAKRFKLVAIEGNHRFYKDDSTR